VIIILERISAKTDIQDIQDFIAPALKGHIFQKSGRLGYIKIEILKDNINGMHEYYALVLVNSDLAAQRIVKKKNMHLLGGRRVKVRQYFVRSWRNDPRNKDDQKNETTVDMRQDDRRKSALEKIVKEKIAKEQDVKFSSDKVFNRKL